MKIIAETERIILRKLTVADAADFYRLNANPKVLKYTGDSPFASIADAKRFLENYIDCERNGFGRRAVVRKEDDVFLGWCGLKFNEENQVDLGFRFFEEYWGKGYATESAEASLRYGFEDLGLVEITARAAADNRASLRVVEKLGMSYWKTGTCHGIDDAHYFRLGRDAYFARGKSN